MRISVIIFILLLVIAASGKPVRWLRLTSQRLSAPAKGVQEGDGNGASRSLDCHIPAEVARLLPAIPALAIMIMATSTCDASPLNQQNVPIRGPFFQGWLIRSVDHARNTSFIIIAGSFSKSGTKAYTQNYLFAAVSSPEVSTHEEVLLSEDDVTVTNKAAPTGKQPFNLVWDAGSHGKLIFSDDSCTGSLNMNGRLSLRFNAFKRLPWSAYADPVQACNPTSVAAMDGPEGWLRRAAQLLPCHYFVHSVGSRCRYELTAGSGLSQRAHRVNGEGFAHIEGNHGRFFPSGWIWSHAIAANNSASFSLALGKFTIAGLTPTTCILYLRRANGRPIVFRTTDLDSIRYVTDRATGTLELNATSLFKNRRLSLVIRPAGNAAAAFKTRVQVPTALGFSNRPGCLETYTATATIKLSKLIGGQAGDGEVYEFPLTALEYGGSFISQHLDM